MNENKNRSLWQYIVIPIAIIVIVGIVVALILPGTDKLNYGRIYSTAEYAEGETALKSPATHEELFEKLNKFITDREKADMTYMTSGCAGAAGTENPTYNMITEEIMDGGASLEAAAEESVADSTTGTSSGTQKDYSDTNIRTEGVMEADIVKTDGNYIYSVRTDNGEFSVVDAKNDLEVLFKGVIFEDLTYKCNEFYVDGDHLYFTGYCSDYIENEFRTRSFLLTYDISDKTAPKLTDTYMQDGEYSTARVIDGVFYLFTNYYVSALDEKNYIPTFGGDRVAAENIYYGKYISGINYYCVGAVNLSHPSSCISAKAVLTGLSDFYVSGETAFILTNDWVTTKKSSYRETNIVALSLDNGLIKGRAIGSVNGYLNDSFSVDEHKGYLRLVTTTDGYSTDREESFFDLWFGKNVPTTSYEQANNLYILDSDLKQVSSIEGLQENETVKSCRFLGDAVYFVTFRQTDPLFAADLSDPANPKILDGLKVTGFSNYLHFYSDDLLLGIGYEADESTGMTTGAKISMFDISDPFNIKEIDRYSISDVSVVSSDFSYKSVMVEPEKNLIGFSTERYYDQYLDQQRLWGTIAEYHVLSYTRENGFSEVLKHEIYDDYNLYDDMYIIDDYKIDYYPEEDMTAPYEPYTNSPSSGEAAEDFEKTDAQLLKDYLGNEAYLLLNTYSIRGLYIDDQFYVVHPGVRVTQFDLNTGKKVNDKLIYEAIN